MSWSPDQWDVFAGLLDRGWPGELEPAGENAYRVLLDDCEPEALVAALKRLLHRGQRFRPSAAELLAEARRDPSAPTFDEAYVLIFGPRGVLAARPSRAALQEARDPRAAHNEAALERAQELHPLVYSFVARQGAERLRLLPLADPQYGELRRKELREAWDAHVEAAEGREVAALASGAGREGLRRLDPLVALEAAAPDSHQIPEEVQ